MQLSKEQIVYGLTLVIAIIGAMIPFLQAVEGVVSFEYASQIALIITVLGLAVPFMVNIIKILNSVNMALALTE
jgi:hypothetical protein